MQTVLQDLRYALRQLGKEKGFTFTAILSLALGIGATTAVFSVIYGILIDPYPYKDAKRMVHVQLIDKQGHMRGLLFNNGPQYRELLQAKCVDEIFMEGGETVTMTGNTLPVSVQQGKYTSNLFTYMGVPPLLGRQFVPADTTDGQTAQVAVLSYLFWRRQFGGSRDILGKTIELNHKPYTIIGVANPRFTWGDSDVYIPYAVTADPKDYLNSFVKLKPGVSLEAAQAELEPLVRQFAQRDPTRYPELAKIKLVTLNEQVLGDFAGTLLLLFSAVALLLVIGCANVSILLLARGTGRMHELALRASVGASRARIIRQLLTESVLLSFLGAVIGITGAFFGVKAIAGALPLYSFPHEAVIHVNVPVLAFSAIVAFLTGVSFGMSPALRLSRPKLSELIQSGTGRHSGDGSGRKTHRALIAGQVALTMVLLVLAGAATRAFMRAYRVPLGYDAESVTNLNLVFPRNAYPKWGDRATKFEAIRQAVANTPGVEQAGILTTWIPPTQAYTGRLEIESKQDVTGMQTQLVLASPEVFQTLGIPIVTGRNFTAAEVTRAAHVALVNQAFVQKYLAGRDPIGQHVRSPDLKVDFPMLISTEGNDTWFEIVGMVGNAHNNTRFRNANSGGNQQEVQPALYVPYTLILPPNVQLMVRTRGDAGSVIRSAQVRLRELDPETAVSTQHPLTWYLETMVWGQQRFIAALFAIFSLLGLALAATGLYSVVSYSVNQRNQEMGIRIALGAQRLDIVELVLRSVAATVGLGIALGLGFSIALNRVVAHWVQTSSRDPFTLIGVAVLLVIIAVLACVWPARRAAMLDPVKALRTQ